MKTGLPLPAVARRWLEQAHEGFTLLELLLAIAIFSGVLVAIYASWTAILRGANVALVAASEAQHTRMAMRALEDALLGAQHFGENDGLYAFEVDTRSDTAVLSFATRLPRAYPRSRKFGFHNQSLRRVEFRVEPGPDQRASLVLRQRPLLFEPDVDEEENPLVLARGLQHFGLRFRGTDSPDWEDEWVLTNQLPVLVEVSLEFEPPERNRSAPPLTVTRWVSIPAAPGGVMRGLQSPVGRPDPRAVPVNRNPIEAVPQ